MAEATKVGDHVKSPTGGADVEILYWFPDASAVSVFSPNGSLVRTYDKKTHGKNFQILANEYLAHKDKKEIRNAEGKVLRAPHYIKEA